MLIRVIDFETTGFSPDASICEVGWCDVVTSDDGLWKVQTPESQLCNPGRVIPPTAAAVHHIKNEDVLDQQEPQAVLATLVDGVDIFAAHKADFERSFWDAGGKPWICTWKIAVRLAPRAPGHSNQVLRYWLKLAVDDALAHPPHRAGPDAYVTAHLLARMLAKMSASEMVELTCQPALLPYLTFGKHAMKPIEEVPIDYLEWCLGQDMDADVKHTCKHYIQNGSRND